MERTCAFKTCGMRWIEGAEPTHSMKVIIEYHGVRGIYVCCSPAHAVRVLAKPLSGDFR